ncbi:MAG: hypothetical protein ABII22_02395 [Candidatus Micrarchaeota archaeon]
MENLDFAVKFPFTDEAKQAIEKMGIQLNEMIVAKAVERIKNDISGKAATKFDLHENEKIEEIASYAAARVLLGYMRNRYLTNKFAVAESKVMASSIKTDEDIERIEKMFNINKTATEKESYLSLPSFLKFAPKSIDYKIINRKIVDGKVLINAREEIRILEEAMRRHLEKIPHVGNPPKSIRDAENELKELLPKIEPQNFSLDAGENPPCIEKIFERTSKHENLSHQERFFLGVYLMNRRMDVEKIIQIFSNLPDYDERITRYQVEHMVKRGYVTPACSKILSYGLCCANCRIGTPLNWRSQKSGQNV